MVADPLRHKIKEKEARAQRMLEKLTKEHLVNNPNAIIRLDEDVKAFGRYTICRNSNTYQVFRGATLAAEPSSSKVAISWCIADKYGKHTLAQELIFLDHEIERRNNDLIHYRDVLERTTDSVKKFVLSDRILECKVRLKHALEQLDKCLNSAKYWQQKGFKDETARIGLKNQSTTNTQSV